MLSNYIGFIDRLVVPKAPPCFHLGLLPRRTSRYHPGRVVSACTDHAKTIEHMRACPSGSKIRVEANQPERASVRFSPTKPRASALRLILKLEFDGPLFSRSPIHAPNQEQGRNRASDHQCQGQAGFSVLDAIVQQIEHTHGHGCDLRWLNQQVAR